MRVYIYKKDATSKRIEVINDVEKVVEKKRVIYIYTPNEVAKYLTKYVKTRIYQN